MVSPIPDALGLDLENHSYPRHVLSYGMGVESTALLLRWIHEPQTRNFDLDDLLVITSHVGDEYSATATDVTECILPEMRRASIRYVQVGRNRLNTTKTGEGITVFSDTTNPTRLYAEGAYTLSDELLAGGTIPQLGGSRRCSSRAKGAALDPIIAKLTAGLPYEHYIGFHSGEITRVRRDEAYNSSVRTGRYPLAQWGWTREDAASYVRAITGREFAKSCCVFCPFSVATVTGRRTTLERYRSEPAAGARALFIEHVALCLNERQGLMGDRRLIDEITAAGLTDVLNRFHHIVETTDHALYEVRRLARVTTGSTPTIARSVKRVSHTGPRTELLSTLAEMPGTPVTGPDNIARKVVRQRAHNAPWAESFYVVGPAVVADKSRPQFDTWWSDITGETPVLFAVTAA